MMTFTNLQQRCQLARDRAERIRAYRYRAMRQALWEAGIGDSGLNVLHNALISREQGRPWSEINYRHARRAARLEASLDGGSEIANRLVTRLLAEFEAARHDE